MMIIHNGHPEKYIPIQDKIGVLVYDFQIKELSDQDIE